MHGVHSPNITGDYEFLEPTFFITLYVYDKLHIINIKIVMLFYPIFCICIPHGSLCCHVAIITLLNGHINTTGHQGYNFRMILYPPTIHVHTCMLKLITPTCMCVQSALTQCGQQQGERNRKGRGQNYSTLNHNKRWTTVRSLQINALISLIFSPPSCSDDMQLHWDPWDSHPMGLCEHTVWYIKQCEINK